jgi:hypothetical protein
MSSPEAHPAALAGARKSRRVSSFISGSAALIHVKDSKNHSLIVGRLQLNGRRREAKMNIGQLSTNKLVRPSGREDLPEMVVAAGSRELAPPTEDREWPLSKPVFCNYPGQFIRRS